jgi:SAM-dependent methyltransferase
MPMDAGNALHCDFDALPFPNQSLDLVLLPHTLELARDPHDTLREVERVLVPEGRVVIVGFNPASLWGLRQQRAHLDRRLGVGLVGLVPGLASLVLSIGIRDRRLGWAARGYAVVAAMVGVPVALWLEINELQPQGMAFCMALAVPILPVSLLMQWDERRRAEAERQAVRQGMK